MTSTRLKAASTLLAFSCGAGYATLVQNSGYDFKDDFRPLLIGHEEVAGLDISLEQHIVTEFQLIYEVIENLEKYSVAVSVSHVAPNALFVGWN